MMIKSLPARKPALIDALKRAMFVWVLLGKTDENLVTFSFIDLWKSHFLHCRDHYCIAMHCMLIEAWFPPSCSMLW